MRIAQRARGLLARRSRRAPQGGRQEGRGADQEGARQVRRAGGGAGPPERSSPTSWRRRSRPSAATASTSRTRWRTRSCRTRRRGSRRTTRPSSWRRCSRRKSATPTRWCSTSTRRASSGCEILPPDVNESGFKFTVVGDKRHPLRPGRRAQRGRAARSSRSSRRAREGRFDDALRPRASASTCGSATSGCSSRSSRPAPATRSAGTARSCSRRSTTALQEAQLAAGRARRGPGVAVRRDAEPRARRAGWRCPTCRPGPRASGWRGRRR